ncbi:MAG: TfuA-like protein [Methylobacteriaceae bacterium]|nr:TfuA-like protein [Methylobacteriaceae bacterium]
MKVAFVGPSLWGEIEHGSFAPAPSVIIRPPAAQGDIFAAVKDGATVIGLIDGLYENVAAPWHKEILFALQSGVAILGGASLGALRAAECAAFGMIGVGRIFDDYAKERRIDDSDVAQIHSPTELGSFPLSAALVNVDATIDRAGLAGVLSDEERTALPKIARSIFFKDLTLDSVASAFYDDKQRARDLGERLSRHWIDQKRIDARQLMDAMESMPDEMSRVRLSWQMRESGIWMAFTAAERRNALATNEGSSPS